MTLIPADFKYCDYALNSPHNRNHCIDFVDLYSSFSLEGQDIEAHCGLFQFNESYREHMDSQGTIKTYEGPCFAKFFVLDIDHEDLEIAKTYTIQILEYLESIGASDTSLLLYFSGNKGFHIAIPCTSLGYSPSLELPRVLKETAKFIAHESGVPTATTLNEGGVDLLYEKGRLIRLPNSKHGSSGLYKINITVSEIKTLSIDQIKDLAKVRRKNLYRPVSAMLPKLAEVISDEEQGLTVLSQTRGFSGKAELKNAKLCIAKLLEGVGAGQRDAVAIRIADHFKKQGLPKSVAHSALQTWNEKNDPPMSDVEIEIKINSAWSSNMDYGCNDHILETHCDSKCFLYSRLVRNQNEDLTKDVDKSFKTTKDLLRSLVERHRMGGGLKLGIGALDEHITLYGGHVLEYMAKSGGGKTSFAMHLMKLMSNLGTKSLFLSLEMSDADVGERSFQMAGPGGQNMLDRILKDTANKSVDEATETLAKQMGDVFKNMITVDEDSASIEDIEKYVFHAKKHFGIKVLFLDYLSRVSQSKSSSYEHISSLAKELKSIAKRHDIVVVYLHQVNRSIENMTSVIELSSGRDSGQTEEAADVVLGSWRPGADTGDESFIIRILKNRRGAINKDVHLEFKPHLMQFKERQVKSAYVTTEF